MNGKSIQAKSLNLSQTAHCSVLTERHYDKRQLSTGEGEFQDASLTRHSSRSFEWSG